MWVGPSEVAHREEAPPGAMMLVIVSSLWKTPPTSHSTESAIPPYCSVRLHVVPFLCSPRLSPVSPAVIVVVIPMNGSVLGHVELREGSDLIGPSHPYS